MAKVQDLNDKLQETPEAAKQEANAAWQGKLNGTGESDAAKLAKICAHANKISKKSAADVNDLTVAAAELYGQEEGQKLAQLDFDRALAEAEADPFGSIFTKDVNDRTQEDPLKAGEDFNAAEEEAENDPYGSLSKTESSETFQGMLGSSNGNLVKMEDYDPELKMINELNSKHTFIESFGGKNCITHTVYNEVTKQNELEFLSIETFKNIYVNRAIPKRDLPLGHCWVQHHMRRTVKSVIFDPSTDKPVVEREGGYYLNLWEGFKCKQAKGSWKRAKKHIWKILCNRDPGKFKYVMKWIAWTLQNPGQRAGVALVFKGEQGAGKGFLPTQMKKIFGPHGMVAGDPERLTGRFNGHLQALCFLFCDEVYWPGDKKAEGVLKNLITEEYIGIERKNRDTVSARNCLHIIMATNNDWAVPAGRDTRRFFVEAVDNRYAKGRASDAEIKAYFDPLWDETDEGGREAMLYDLLRYDLKKWHPRKDVPDTAELNAQREISLGDYERAVLHWLESGEVPSGLVPDSDGNYIIPAKMLSDHVFAGMDQTKLNRGKRRIGELFGKLGVPSKLMSIKGDKVKCRVIHKGSLKEVRSAWDREMFAHKWDEQDSWVSPRSAY